MPVAEEKYTLAQAKIMFGRQHCAFHGHTLKIIKIVRTGWMPPPEGCPGGWHCINCDIQITFTYPDLP